MGLETATFVADLVSSNPPTSDPETQGANHLQLIKVVLQNTFGTSTRRLVGIPQVINVSASGALGASATNADVLVNTSGGVVNLTLPTLGALDAGWECRFIKTTVDSNPFYLVPPAGTITSGELVGLAKARRCIPGRRTKVLWTGSGFIAERVNWGPIGSMVDTANGTLAVGYEWPNGQTLSGIAGSVYPEWFAIFGGLITPDLRGRAIFGLDNMGGGAPAGRITVAGLNFDGTVNGNAGGGQNHTLLVTEMPAHTHPVFIRDPGHVHTAPANRAATNDVGGGSYAGGGSTQGNLGSLTNSAVTGVHANSVNGGGAGTDDATASIGGGAAHTIMPPAMTLGKLLVVE